MENTKNLLHEFIKYLEKDKKNNDNAKKALTWATSGDTSKKECITFLKTAYFALWRVLDV